MNEKSERSQWFSHEEKKKDAETGSKDFTQSLFCVKSCALADYIGENLLAADLKWSLFCAACNSYRFDSVLKPFPPFFLLQENVKEIERLRKIIELCPSMPNVLKQLKDNTLSLGLKDLLYWVLICLNEPIFKYVVKEEHHNILAQVSFKIPATMPDYVFSVTYNSRHQQKFALSTGNHSTKFAFHGSRLDNFYSIINYGLQVSFNKASHYVAAFGPGIYLSNEMIVSLPYSPRGFTWSSSLFGSHVSVVALCEVINHPDVRSEFDSANNSIFKMNDNQSSSGKYIIVGNSDLVRVQYLLLYNADESESASLLESPTLIGWIKRHKMFTLVLGYVILLLGIGCSNSSFFYKYYRKLLRRFDSNGDQW